MIDFSKYKFRVLKLYLISKVVSLTLMISSSLSSHASFIVFKKSGINTSHSNVVFMIILRSIASSIMLIGPAL